jgi:hypothetical protein
MKGILASWNALESCKFADDDLKVIKFRVMVVTGSKLVHVGPIDDV